MTNPYMDRVTARMRADDAIGKLNQHWSARGERYVNRVGYWLGKCGLERFASWYTDATAPLVEWFGYRQSVFLRRYF